LNRRATCWNPQVKGLTLMVNSLFNGWRMEDIWLDGTWARSEA
jgi:peptide/nickel transport system substrate-binding protein